MKFWYGFTIAALTAFSATAQTLPPEVSRVTVNWENMQTSLELLLQAHARRTMEMTQARDTAEYWKAYATALLPKEAK